MTIQDQYIDYLRLELSLSENTALAYRRDVAKLFDYLEGQQIEPIKATSENLKDFVIATFRDTSSAKSQARILSGVKSFYRYLLYTGKIESDPTELLESPKIGVYLPSVLTLDEIDAMVNAIVDENKPESPRNRAIIEMLYGSGLRVSELVNLKISNIKWNEGYMLVEGKGSKQRFVPISPTAESAYRVWESGMRSNLTIDRYNSDYAFLNRRGKQLTRVMVFYIIKDAAQKAGIKKNISPHTLRHSFATHLLQNGADIRIIQELLGHESITTTEVYTHIDINDLRSAIETFHPANRRKLSE